MLLPKFDYHDPSTIKEALELKKFYGEDSKFLAGGTDIIVHLKKRLSTASHIIDLSKIHELYQIKKETGLVSIGACVTMAQLSDSDIIKENFSALETGALSLGNHLIRNKATIGGNVCNASPAGDTLPALMIYNASIQIESIDAKREVSIEKFFKGPGKTDLNHDEIVTGFNIELPRKYSGAHYIQLGKRKSSEINIVNVASFIQYEPDTQKIIKARIALGSVAATPVRSYIAEKVLENNFADHELFFKAAEAARKKDCDPIDDFRGSARYRQAMVGILTKRTLTAAFEKAKVS